MMMSKRKLLKETAYSKAVREARRAIRGPNEGHIIESNGSCWHPAVIVSKRTLRVLLIVAAKAECI